MFLSSSRLFNSLGNVLRLAVLPQRRSVVVEPTTRMSTHQERQAVPSQAPETPCVLTDDSPVEKQPSIEERVDQLFSQACRRYPTYEVMVNKDFAASMRKVFGDDEQGDEDAIKAFEYAREEFDYLSPEEEERLDAENAANGICSHGLDYDICPCGCGSL